MRTSQGKSLGIVSTKGGVGKTTTSINLASQLSLRSIDVVYIDCDFHNANGGIYLGLPYNANTLHGFLDGSHSIHDAKYLHPSGLIVIPYCFLSQIPLILFCVFLLNFSMPIMAALARTLLMSSPSSLLLVFIL